MVLVNVGSGSRSVYVRVDDLALAERERVHGAVDAVRRIVGRDEHPSVVGALTAVIVISVSFCAMTMGSSTEGAMAPVLAGLALLFVPGFASGGLAFYVVAGITARADRQDGERLQQLVAQSARVREFVAACHKQCAPSMAKKMAALVPLPAPATV